MTTEVIIEDDRWEAAGLEALAVRAVAATLGHLGFEGDDWEVVVLGCDDARIAVLNSDFRGKPTATNVLSWPSEERGAEHEGATPELPESAGELGDIAIAFETCRDEARTAGLDLGAHATHLIVHGTLHLLGYDHVREGDGDLMEAVEIAILQGLGLENPYRGTDPA